MPPLARVPEAACEAPQARRGRAVRQRRRLEGDHEGGRFEGGGARSRGPPTAGLVDGLACLRVFAGGPCLQIVASSKVPEQLVARGSRRGIDYSQKGNTLLPYVQACVGVVEGGTDLKSDLPLSFMMNLNRGGRKGLIVILYVSRCTRVEGGWEFGPNSSRIQ